MNMNATLREMMFRIQLGWQTFRSSRKHNVWTVIVNDQGAAEVLSGINPNGIEELLNRQGLRLCHGVGEGIFDHGTIKKEEGRLLMIEDLVDETTPMYLLIVDGEGKGQFVCSEPDGDMSCIATIPGGFLLEVKPGAKLTFAKSYKFPQDAGLESSNVRGWELTASKKRSPQLTRIDDDAARQFIRDHG